MGTSLIMTDMSRNSCAHSTAIEDQFAVQGYVGPIRVLSPRECKQFRRVYADRYLAPPLDWEKGSAVTSRAFFEIASHPALVKVLTALLGKDVMLWGASVQRRCASSVHPWHSDIESSSAPPGKTASVWIGIRHTNVNSSLLLIPYSHRFGSTVQEARCQSGVLRDETADEDIVRWAREQDKRSDLLRPEMTDGEALIFDGQLWHGSHNLSGKTREALLLQYATPDTLIRIPDLNYLNWPFHQLQFPKPACIMVNGSAKSNVNRIVSPPAALGGGASHQLTSRIYPLQIPLNPDTAKGWKPYPIFAGSTGGLRLLTCHASTLTQGQCPHPPHTHDEEELLLMLAGDADLILPANSNGRMRLGPGQFVYYPAHFAHTLETVSEDAANYLMFKWYAGKTGSDSPLAFGQFDISDYAENESARDDFCPNLVFEGPTAYLRKLHCHISTLAPFSGYEPHIDAYDVAIIVLQGEVETLGERIGPHGVIFYPAGEPHGMYNPGQHPAQYIVFEFHGSQTKLTAKDLLARSPSLLTKLRDPKRVKRKLKGLLKRYVHM